MVVNEVAQQSASEIFLSVAFTSGLEEVVVPFFDPGLPTEYELTRSIRVVSKTGRKKVGILATDAKMLGGFDFRSMGQETEWPFVTELKKQYEVSSVALDAPDPQQPRRSAGGPAVVDDAEADRYLEGLRPPGASDAAVPRPLADVQPVAGSRGPQDAAGRSFRWRPSARAEGQLAVLV